VRGANAADEGAAAFADGRFDADSNDLSGALGPRFVAVLNKALWGEWRSPWRVLDLIGETMQFGDPLDVV